MDEQTFSALFCDIFRKNGLERFCLEPTVNRFYRFTELLLQVNAHTNLTAIREIPDIIAKHYADCLLAEPYFPKGAAVLDVGCGGGFPSIPLAIVRQDLQITAVDSTAKKIAFVQEVTASQSIGNLHPICGRIEDSFFLQSKGKYDVATSRAVARLPVLSELLLPYVRTGGLMIALKGNSGADELKEATEAIQILGAAAQTDNILTLQCADHSEVRHVITIQKSSKTPPQYPRSYSAIQKKPL